MSNYAGKRYSMSMKWDLLMIVILTVIALIGNYDLLVC
jgi:hypothetical protein